MKIQGLTQPSFDEKACPVTIEDAENIYHFDTTLRYTADVSASSSFVYGVESFKQQVKEIPFGVQANVGGLMQKAGKTINEYFPDGVNLFNGMVNVKIGDKLKKGGEVLSRAANRNLDVVHEKYLRENPRLAEAQESVAFDFGSQGANWATMLLTGPYSPYLMAGLTMTGETQERLQTWKQTHGTVDGYEQRQGDDSVFNIANAFVQGTIEKYLGSWAQVKAVKKGWGYVKAIGKNAIQEGFIEEPLQDVVDFYFDKISGFSEDEQLKDRLVGSLRGYVIASIFGGAGGYSAALYHRSTGIDMYKDAMKNTVPEQDLEKVATKAYEQDAKTMRDIITVELENSSSLRAKRGEVFESMYKNALQAVQDARKQGAYPELRTEEDVASYVKAESERFADMVLAEANRRNTVIEEVLEASDIVYENGRLQIKMTKGARDVLANQEKRLSDIKEVEKDLAILRGEKRGKKEKKEPTIIQQLRKIGITKEFADRFDIRGLMGLQDEKFGASGLFRKTGKIHNEESLLSYLHTLGYISDVTDTAEGESARWDRALNILETASIQGKEAETDVSEIYSLAGVDIQNDTAEQAKEKLDNYFTEQKARSLQEEISSLNEEEQERFAMMTIEGGMSDEDAMAEIRATRAEEEIPFPTFYDESLDVANENARLDEINPAYEGETININGVERTVYNSNGDRIAMSEPALRNFYKWFGDSRVVDEQGRPLVVYHGTNKDFEIFSKKFLGKTTQAESAKKGFFFTDDTEVADSYADYAAIYQPINELLEKQRQAEKEGNWDLFDKLTIEIEEKDREISQTPANQRGKKVYAVYLKANNVTEYDAKDEYFSDIGEDINKVLDKAIKDKKDGVIIKNLKDQPNVYDEKSANHFVVFDSNQIKSTSNRGTYSESENIYLQSAFAGSRVDYDEPSLEAIGSGEGAQAHGWGLYYALNKDVAEGYRKKFITGDSLYDNYSYKGNKELSYTEDETLASIVGIAISENKDIENIIKEKIADYEKTIQVNEENIEDNTEFRQEIINDSKEAIAFLKNLNPNDVEINKGQTHEVDIPENPYLLDEQKRRYEQSEFVQKALDSLYSDLIDVVSQKISPEHRQEAIDTLKNGEKAENLTLEEIQKTGYSRLKSLIKSKYTDGHWIYDDLSKILGSDKAASQMLEKYGIKGITYEGAKDGRCFVIFNPDDVKVIQKFYQGGKGGVKGSIEFKPDVALIRLTDSANASTLAHELAHYWLQNTFLYNKSGLATPEYNNFFKSISSYLGITDDQEKIERWQQEKWARAYEQYLLTQKAPNPELQQAFTDYNKWIKRAYRMLKSKPKYRNAEGKLVEPKLTPEIIEVFGRLTNEFVARPDIEQIAETVTPALENAVVDVETKVTEEIQKAERASTYPTTQLRDVAEEGETGRSAVAMRVLGEELGYDVKNIDEQMNQAREFVKKNLSEARAVVNGKEAPNGLLSTAVNIAYVEAMENSGNFKEAERAIRIRSLEQTRRGQEIAMERATTDNILSSEYWSNLLIARKTQEVAKKSFNGDVKKLQSFIKKESETIAKELVGKSKEERKKIIQENLERIAQESDILLQEDYDDLLDKEYYNEILNETQLMIENGLGLKADDEQIDFIHNNVRQLKDIVKDTVSENGNLSIEAFKQIRKMHDTIDSYTPSSNLAIWSSIVGRGVMLLSVKSPTLNIISNIENYTTETLARKGLNAVTGQTNDSIVSDKLKSDYLKWDDEVYKASGYMPSVTQDILGETPILGEKRLSSQGEGKIRAVGRFVEDTVFKYGLGYFDNKFKANMFVDVVSNKATQQAYDEGLSGDKAKARADELFSDAVLLKPMTEEGQNIRKLGMIAAHEATYTQDSEISRVALKIRDVLNSGEFKAGDFLVPFVKTPANVVALGMEYSLGSLYTAYHIKDIMANPTSEISQKAIKSGVRNGLGVILSMMLAALVDDDDYIPEYANASPKQRDIAKLKNAPFNSIRIGNKWINLDYFGPLAIPMAGILTARSKKNLSGFLQGVGGQAMKTPGIKEINDLVGDVSRAIQYGVSFEDVAKDVFEWGVEQAVSRTVPAIITDLGKLIDTYERETGGEMARRIMAKLPIVRERLPIRTDITGRKVETEPTNILFGARVKTAVDNKVVNEIDRLNKQGLAPTLSDPTRYGKFRGLDTDTKDKVRAEFNKEYGVEARKLINSSSYSVMNDTSKKKALNKIRKKISDKLKRKYLKKGK